MITYGKYIKMKREEKGYSQRKLGLVSGISNTTISRMENDETEAPEIKTLKAIEKALNLEDNEIVYIAYPPVESDTTEYEDSKNKKLADEIIRFLIEKDVIQKGEELSDEKKKWLFTLLDKAIDMSRM